MNENIKSSQQTSISSFLFNNCASSARVSRKIVFSLAAAVGLVGAGVVVVVVVDDDDVAAAVVVAVVVGVEVESFIFYFLKQYKNKIFHLKKSLNNLFFYFYFYWNFIFYLF